MTSLADMGYRPNANAPGYWQYDGLSVHADVETHQATVQAARRLLTTGARVLDVGAGSGALTKALMDRGFELSVTSWNERVKLPVPSYRIDLDQAFDADAVGGLPYAMVCAIEVIEHVENPAQLFRSLAGLVQPDGWLALSTPNVESPVARLQWLMRGHPSAFGLEEIRRNRHISILWRQGLEHFAEMAGFDIVEKQGLGDIRYHGPGGRWVRRPLHALMSRWLPGDVAGTSRWYLFRRSSRASRRLGAEDVA